MILARIICYFKGHRRGVRVAAYNGKIEYRCPRCRATWARKGKA